MPADMLEAARAPGKRPGAVRLPRAAALAAAALVVAAGLSPAAARAAEFRSVASAGAVLYDGPSAKARKLWIAPRGMPVEVLASPDPVWVKARDVGGDQFWIPRRDLSDARSLITVAPATIRQGASEGASPVLQLERGVLLEPIEPAAGGWVRVRHREGATGWVRADEVWGQ